MTVSYIWSIQKVEKYTGSRPIKDPQFGPMLTFCIGGVFVELLKDVSFKIVPLRENDASDMLSEIKAPCYRVSGDRNKRMNKPSWIQL